MQQQDKTIDGYDREIGELRKEIESAGDKLDREPTITNFKQFRDILSKLAKRINAEAYRLEKGGGRPQNPRYYEIIPPLIVRQTNFTISSCRNKKIIWQSQLTLLASKDWLLI